LLGPPEFEYGILWQDLSSESLTIIVNAADWSMASCVGVLGMQSSSEQDLAAARKIIEGWKQAGIKGKQGFSECIGGELRWHL
jgi:hypothetical protein